MTLEQYFTQLENLLKKGLSPTLRQSNFLAVDEVSNPEINQWKDAATDLLAVDFTQWQSVKTPFNRQRLPREVENDYLERLLARWIELDHGVQIIQHYKTTLKSFYAVIVPLWPRLSENLRNQLDQKVRELITYLNQQEQRLRGEYTAISSYLNSHFFLGFKAKPATLTVPPFTDLPCQAVILHFYHPRTDPHQMRILGVESGGHVALEIINGTTTHYISLAADNRRLYRPEEAERFTVKAKTKLGKALHVPNFNELVGFFAKQEWDEEATRPNSEYFRYRYHETVLIDCEPPTQLNIDALTRWAENLLAEYGYGQEPGQEKKPYPYNFFRRNCAYVIAEGLNVLNASSLAGEPPWASHTHLITPIAVTDHTKKLQEARLSERLQQGKRQGCLQLCIIPLTRAYANIKASDTRLAQRAHLLTNYDWELPSLPALKQIITQPRNSMLRMAACIQNLLYASLRYLEKNGDKDLEGVLNYLLQSIQYLEPFLTQFSTQENNSLAELLLHILTPLKKALLPIQQPLEQWQAETQWVLREIQAAVKQEVNDQQERYAYPSVLHAYSSYTGEEAPPSDESVLNHWLEGELTLSPASLEQAVFEEKKQDEDISLDYTTTASSDLRERDQANVKAFILAQHVGNSQTSTESGLVFPPSNTSYQQNRDGLEPQVAAEFPIKRYHAQKFMSHLINAITPVTKVLAQDAAFSAALQSPNTLEGALFQKIWQLSCALQELNYQERRMRDTAAAPSAQFYQSLIRPLKSTLGKLQTSLYLNRPIVLFQENYNLLPIISDLFGAPLPTDSGEHLLESMKNNIEKVDSRYSLYLTDHAAEPMRLADVASIPSPAWWDLTKRAAFACLKTQQDVIDILAASYQLPVGKIRALQQVIKAQRPSWWQFWRRDDKKFYHDLQRRSELYCITEAFQCGELTAVQFCAELRQHGYRYTWQEGSVYKERIDAIITRIINHDTDVNLAQERAQACTTTTTASEATNLSEGVVASYRKRQAQRHELVKRFEPFLSGEQRSYFNTLFKPPSDSYCSEERTIKAVYRQELEAEVAIRNYKANTP